MHLIKLTTSKDNAWKSIRQLGHVKLSHFINLNKESQPYELVYAPIMKRG